MKIKGLRWWIIGMIALATVINYIDRSALAMMWPGISEELGMTKAHYAIILNVFMVAYALGQTLGGRMFDKVGTRIGYVITIVIWGASSFLHSVARSVASFSIFRATLGIGEAGNWPGAAKSNAEWFPSKERAVAQGIFNAGASLGSVIAPPLIAIIYAAVGWKVAFMIIGSFGLVWIIPWLIIHRGGPEKHPWITDLEREYIIKSKMDDLKASGAKTDQETVLPLGQILKRKESWSVLIGRFFLEPIWWLFVGWMPIYLAETYGFHVKEIGMFAWVPYVGAATGSIIGGAFAGRLIGKGKSINAARKTTIIVGGSMMFLGLVATILFGSSPYAFVGIVAGVLFGFQFAIGNVQTIPSDLFSGKNVGTLAGFGGSVGIFSVIIMNFLVPWISDKFSYIPIFVMIAVFVPLGVFAIFFFAPKIQRLKVD